MKQSIITSVREREKKKKTNDNRTIIKQAENYKFESLKDLGIQSLYREYLLNINP